MLEPSFLSLGIGIRTQELKPKSRSSKDGAQEYYINSFHVGAFFSLALYHLHYIKDFPFRNKQKSRKLIHFLLLPLLYKIISRVQIAKFSLHSSPVQAAYNYHVLQAAYKYHVGGVIVIMEIQHTYSTLMLCTVHIENAEAAGWESSKSEKTLINCTVTV